MAPLVLEEHKLSPILARKPPVIDHRNEDSTAAIADDDNNQLTVECDLCRELVSFEELDAHESFCEQ